MNIENVITRVLQDVAELPDRTSPADEPDVMFVTAKELEAILRAHLQRPKMPWELEGRKPTIAELEAILNCPEPHNIEILPDGSIRAVPLPDAT